MEEFKSNKNNKKWYQKINWKKIIIIFTIVLLICFFAFNYLGRNKDIVSALTRSIIIASLIIIELIVSDLVENRKKIIFLDKKDLFYVEIHDQKDGKFISDTDFDMMIKNRKIKEVYNNIEDYEGIDCGHIKEVLSIRKDNNRLVVIANVNAKEWVPIGKITVKKLELQERNYNKKIIIPNDFDNYDELYKLLDRKIVKK